MINQFYIDYIKAIENPDRVGWNGKVWTAPQYKGYDKNQRGYGIDIVKNDSAKRLTQNRPGQWLTEGEADKLMKEHLLYVYGAAQKHIEGFDNLSDRRKAALLGMLYRGDSVNKNRHIIDINEPDDNKFFESISNYYKSKGLNERARNSSNFFNNNQLTNFLIPMKWEQWEPPMKFKSGGQIRKMLTAAGGPIYEEDWSDRWEPYAAKIGLAGDVVGLGTAATGVGIPVGTAIAGFANIPNLIIDGYQTARDTWRSFNDNGNSLGSAAWNGGELILDATGLKALQYINKATKAGVASEKYLTSTEKALDSKPWKRVGTGHGRVRARQSADRKRKYNIRRNKALEESNIELAKRGVRPAQGLYYQQKLTDEMAKRGYGVAVNDAIKSANRTLRQNLAAINTINGGTNIYHLLPKRKSGGLIRKMETAAGGPIKKPIKRLKDGYRYIPDEENGGWDRISDNSMSDVFATMEFTPKKTKVGSSITRKQSAPSKTYYSAYNPEDVIKFFNIMTLGGFDRISPVQNGRALYDLGKFAYSKISGKPGMTWSGFTNSLINGNNGLVSLKFSEEHPYLSTGINLVGDAVALGGISGAKKLTNISRPNVNVTANVGITAEQGTTALSLEEILKAFEVARQWHLNRINSPGYTNRALRAGFTKEEIPQLLQLLTSLINRLKLLRPEEVLGSNIRLNHNLNGKPSAGYWRTNLNGDLKQGISFYDTNASYDDAVSNFIHEFGHGATFGLNGTETSGYMKALADQFPLINRAVKYNRSLYPEINAGRVELAAPGAIRTGNVGYFASPTEMLSRGYEFMRDYGNNWFKAYKSGKLSSTTHLDLVGSRENSNIFNIIATPKGAVNFLKNALGISVPLGLGGYGLYNNDNQQQQLQYLKQGGKMNILEFLKKGSGIHIKEKNKGKFTSYCGGKVTDECILKGKNSSNPAIRKRATFAANARKWKHKEGGIIKAEEGTKTNWWSKIGEGINKGVNSKAGLYIAQGLLLGLGSIFGGNNSSDISNVAKNYNIQQLNAYDELELYKLYSLMKSSVDPENPNANKGVPMQILPGKIRDIEKRMLERQIQLEEINTLLKLDNQKSNLYLDIFSTALGVISNNNSNKTTKNNTSQLNGSPSKTTITSTNNNILKTGYEPYKSGYVDLFGNISTGMGFKFDKNFNVVPFDKSFNYQPLKLNV